MILDLFHYEEINMDINLCERMIEKPLFHMNSFIFNFNFEAIEFKVVPIQGFISLVKNYH